MSGDMLIVEVCRMFGWDYYQYLAQPTFFLELIHKKLEIDGKKQAAEEAKAKHNTPRPRGTGKI